MRKINKKGLEFGFGWMFALIVGAVILFLAIYSVNSLVKTERVKQDTATAKQFGIVLTPIETSLEEDKVSPPIVFPSTSRVYSSCEREGNFGVQKIGVSSSSGIGDKYQIPEIMNSFYNKYIFSSSIIEGKKMFVFAKPFEMPFKIADLMYIWGDGDFYCFVSPPTEVRESLESLDLPNANVTDYISQCKINSTKVCFGSSAVGCDVVVAYNAYAPENGIVVKNGVNMNYQGYALMYGAIFSAPAIYECQVERLMKRASSLALIYKEKTDLVSSRANGCGSAMGADFTSYATIASSINESKGLSNIGDISELIRGENGNAICQMF